MYFFKDLSTGEQNLQANLFVKQVNKSTFLLSNAMSVLTASSIMFDFDTRYMAFKPLDYNQYFALAAQQ